MSTHEQDYAFADVADRFEAWRVNQQPANPLREAIAAARPSDTKLRAENEALRSANAQLQQALAAARDNSAHQAGEIQRQRRVIAAYERRDAASWWETLAATVSALWFDRLDTLTRRTWLVIALIAAGAVIGSALRFGL